MFRRLGVAGLVLFGCIFALGFSLEIAAIFLGHRVNEHGLFLLVVPMAVVSAIAAQSGSPLIRLPTEIIKIFAFAGAAMISSDTGRAPLMLLLLAIGYVGVYAMPVIKGWHYIFVMLPLQREAQKQRTLTTKLDAEGDLAAATLRYERARAALADAELATAEAEQRRRARQ
jgi:hypothetical protein